MFRSHSSCGSVAEGIEICEPRSCLSVCVSLISGVKGGEDQGVLGGGGGGAQRV